MGFYIRKSVSVGPFRLNLSKSGVGLSVGVKGFRVGVGPSGRYIHMGSGGLYYRKTFSDVPTSSPRREAQPSREIPPERLEHFLFFLEAILSSFSWSEKPGAGHISQLLDLFGIKVGG